ncbi:MAG: hypothetical protein KAU27_01060 [Desulfuromonadales bacterium]|nr:hypothetical protein [Desulfuromonadales bacterium]
MSDSISRKQFFHEVIQQTAQVSFDLFQTLFSPPDNQQRHINHALEADLPPELLADEAKRLGLDPEDKEGILAAISEKLNKAQI